MRTPLFTPKRIAFILVVALLLLAIGLWMNKPNSPSVAPLSSVPKPTVAPDTSIVEVVQDTNKLAALAKKPVMEKRPTSTKQVPKQPASASQRPKPAEALTQAPYDQLVMRNGDLIDAKVLEIGINEIRYKKCHWKDSPDYVVPKADVLSIRHADGEIERFTTYNTASVYSTT
ncbi:hypothetical protein ACFSUS_19590 [Spirosoma soli]|uniref:Uncharacterized protein n=1 Tax=Spirosoma soli TaxID=1770529 RepID=A0ABW5M822_9BACT